MSDFFDAIRAGDVGRVSSMLDSDPRLIDAEENGVSALMTATYHGRADVARALVKRGKKLTFFEACALGDLDRVRELLAADPTLLNAHSNDGFPGLGLSIFFRQPAVARFLIESGADVKLPATNAMRVSPIHAAVASCDRETTRLLLERGADPNALQQSDYSPLHGAAGRGDVEMAKMLIAAGADRTLRGSDGKSVADVARDHGHAEFASWFESLTR